MEKIRQRSRRNGWGCPPHLMQISAWLLLVHLSALEFGLLVPAFPSLATRVVIGIVMALLILLLVVAKLVVTTIDPADDSVRNKLRSRQQPDFDRDKNGHVISDNFFCNICEETVHSTSKHCRQCNKCVLDFDHHCKWLNNCVGNRNYKWFLIFVGVTVLTSACISIQAAVTLILYSVHRKILYHSDEKLTLFGGRVSDGVWLGFLISTILISTLISALTFHLFIFHMRLVNRGLTTYNYIMDLRRKKQSNLTPNKDKWEWFTDLRAKFSARNSENGSAASAESNDQTQRNGRNSKSAWDEDLKTRDNFISQVPKLPPVHIRNPTSSVRAKNLQNINYQDVPYDKMSNEDSPKEQENPISNVSGRVPYGRSTVSIGVNANRVAPQEISVKLPPIRQKKLYEPHFETVLISERELTLPSIMVTSTSETESLADKNEIPLRALGLTDSNSRENAVYITSGKITVAKIQFNEKAAEAEDSGAGNYQPIEDSNEMAPNLNQDCATNKQRTRSLSTQGSSTTVSTTSTLNTSLDSVRDGDKLSLIENLEVFVPGFIEETTITL